MGTYTTSDGERISQSVLNGRIRRAKIKKLANVLDEYGYHFCEDCKRSSDIVIDCSHTISVQKCKDWGSVEIAYDVENIKLRCRECHRKHDGLNLKFER